VDKAQSISVVSILWRRKLIVIGVTILALAASLAFSLTRTPLYRAEAELIRDRGSLDVTLFGTAIYQSGDVQRDLLTTAQSIASLRVATLVKSALHSPLPAPQLLSMVQATASAEANTIKLEVKGPDPKQAAMIADEFAKQAILLRRESDKASLVAARQALEAQVAMMNPADLSSSLGQQLQARIEQLRILEQVQTGGYSLWQSAQVPSSPYSPRPLRDGAAGLVVGLVLGLVLAIASDRMDRTLKGQPDFENEYQLPVLAAIPRVGRKWSGHDGEVNGFIGFSGNGAASIESYRLLRSNLQYFEVERKLRSILITSGLSGEAKTSTAINLALSLAISGARVALVDTDLRNPQMHRYLGLDNRIGLSSLLAGGARVEDSIKVCKTSTFLPLQEDEGLQTGANQSLMKDFLCLTSGPLPPNPAELLASPRMIEILQSVTTLTDYVIIDSAPLLLVADAVPLASRVDGVIVVSRAGSTTTEQARQVRGMLEKIGARLVGVVMSDAKLDGRKNYRHGYYQSEG